MLNFQLLPGDKYDGRCAEIYITEKQFLIYHCSVCEEIYATFNELLSHITKDHYENTKEYIDEEVVEAEKVKENELLVVEEGKNLVNAIKSQETKSNNEENQLNTKEFKSKTKFEVNFVIKNITIEQSNKLKENEAINLPNNEEILTKDDLPANNYEIGKHSPQRKKPRLFGGMLKNYAISKNKSNSLTRYHFNCQEERKYVCAICGFAFKEKYNLRGHLLRHSNQKNFSCSQCPKRFFTKVELRLHEYRHNGGDRSYLCNHCGMGFVSSSSLTQHIKKQHSLNHTLKCQQCSKTFNNFDLLKIHQLVHFEPDTKEPNKCGDCKEKIQKENIANIDCENCDLVGNTKITLKEHLNAKTISKFKNAEEEAETCDKFAESLVEEGVLTLEQTFDEYELVQTLTDLECKKTF